MLGPSAFQLVLDAVEGVTERLAQEVDVIGGEVEGDGSAATRRVLDQP